MFDEPTKPEVNYLDPNYLIPHHYTLDIYDSSKLTTHQRCPREFFFTYVMGWKPDRESMHVLIGSAFHKGMDYILKAGAGPETLQPAFDIFMEEHRKNFTELEDEDLKAKSPANIYRAYKMFIEEEVARDWEPLHIEIPGTVSVNDTDHMTLRMDVVVRRRSDGLIAPVDHKTTSVEGNAWRQQWALSLQMGTYIHALSCVFPPEEVFGAIVNGVVLRTNANADKVVTRGPRKGLPYANSGKGTEFVTVEVQRTVDSMDAWLSDVNYEIEEIKQSRAMLETGYNNSDQTVMTAFPRRTYSCPRYNSICPYHGICVGCANPLRVVEAMGQEPPPGFVQSYWDPTKHETVKLDGTPAKTVKESFVDEWPDTLSSKPKAQPEPAADEFEGMPKGHWTPTDSETGD